MKKRKGAFVIVLIGPMGCGKTTIGLELSDYLQWPFHDADDYHPEENKRKMSMGIPLGDNDRQPWLEVLRRLIDQYVSEGRSMILACSALKQKYRRMLGIDQQRVVSVFLKGSRKLLLQRVVSRTHEFMAKDLLQSQLDTLEEPTSGIIVDISGTPEEIRKEIVRKLDEKDYLSD